MARLPLRTLSAVVSLLVLALPMNASAKGPKQISGELSRPGYTVIALAEDGEGESADADPKFKLRPPAGRVTLHLRGPDGVYAGPIVVDERRNGKLAVEGVKRGAKLGEVKVKRGDGYAKVADLADKWIDPERAANAKKGVPIGAGKVGLVRAKVPREPPPGDLDADGVADAFDVDDDGNLVLDRYDAGDTQTLAAPSDRGAAAEDPDFRLYAVVLSVNADGSVGSVRLCGSEAEVTPVGPWPGDEPPIVGQSYFFEVDEVPGGYQGRSATGPLGAGCPAIAFVPIVTPGLFLTLRETVNANAAALTQADFDATLAQKAFLRIEANAGSRRDVDRIELDCGSLSYCTTGGTGLANPNLAAVGSDPRSWPLAFPDCCDADANGFGELGPLEFAGPPASGNVNALYSPGANSDQIGTGDVLNWRITQADGESEFPTTLQEIYATVPALLSYSDGDGNTVPVTYPVPPPYVGSPGDFGTGEGFPVAPCPPGAPAPCVDGDVVLTLEFWRPQRETIPADEQHPWTDVGGLVYSPGASTGGPIALPNCDPGHLSTTDPHLTLAPSRAPFSDGYGFRDSAIDEHANPANTLSFSVNLSQCLGRTLNPGEKVNFWLLGALANGTAGTGGAYQRLLFTVQ